MNEHALTSTAESEDEGPLAKVGRERNAGIRRMGIELPPLNAALVEVHTELVKVIVGVKDMAIKNKNVLKKVKLTQDQLQKAQERIAQLESNTTTVQHIPGPTPNNNEVKAQTAIAAKAKRVMQLADTDIDRLHVELRQSSNKEADIRAKGRWVAKALEDKLNAEIATDISTKEGKRKLQEEAKKTKAIIAGLRELIIRKKAWYDEQIVREREQTHQVEILLNNEMGWLEEL